MIKSSEDRNATDWGVGVGVPASMYEILRNNGPIKNKLINASIIGPALGLSTYGAIKLLNSRRKKNAK